MNSGHSTEDCRSYQLNGWFSYTVSMRSTPTSGSYPLFHLRFYNEFEDDHCFGSMNSLQNQYPSSSRTPRNFINQTLTMGWRNTESGIANRRELRQLFQSPKRTGPYLMPSHVELLPRHLLTSWLQIGHKVWAKGGYWQVADPLTRAEDGLDVECPLCWVFRITFVLQRPSLCKNDLPN